MSHVVTSEYRAIARFIVCGRQLTFVHVLARFLPVAEARYLITLYVVTKAPEIALYRLYE